MYGYGFNLDCFKPLPADLTKDCKQIEPSKRLYNKVMEEQEKFSPDHYMDDNFDPERLSEI